MNVNFTTSVNNHANNKQRQQLSFGAQKAFPLEAVVSYAISADITPGVSKKVGVEIQSHMMKEKIVYDNFSQYYSTCSAVLCKSLGLDSIEIKKRIANKANPSLRRKEAEKIIGELREKWGDTIKVGQLAEEYKGIWLTHLN